MISVHVWLPHLQSTTFLSSRKLTFHTGSHGLQMSQFFFCFCFFACTGYAEKSTLRQPQVVAPASCSLSAGSEMSSSPWPASVLCNPPPGPILQTRTFIHRTGTLKLADTMNRTPTYKGTEDHIGRRTTRQSIKTTAICCQVRGAICSGIWQTVHNQCTHKGSVLSELI